MAVQQLIKKDYKEARDIKVFYKGKEVDWLAVTILKEGGVVLMDVPESAPIDPETPSDDLPKRKVQRKKKEEPSA